MSVKFAAALSPIALVASIAVIGTAAKATTVNAVLSATYFEVAADNSDPDFPNNFPSVDDGSQLGPNGLPVGKGVADLHGVDSVTGDGEITWWSPSLNPHVVQTGTGLVSLPYSSNMYAPNSTGGNDNAFFETAVFKGQFTLSSASTVKFDLGSDDDSFIYVDGQLFGQNPGIHGVSYVTFTTPTLSASTHNIAIFYADRQHTGAYLQLNLNADSSGIVITPPVSGVPEPAAWAMMIGGIGFVGAAVRRRFRLSEKNFNEEVRRLAQPAA